MAENESLDIGTEGGRRWQFPLGKIRNADPVEDVVPFMRKRIYKALRKVRTEFGEAGISFEQLFAARQDPRELRRLLGANPHEYADLLAGVFRSSPDASNREVIRHWLQGILGKVFDQYRVTLAGSPNWLSISILNTYLKDVHLQLDSDVSWIAKKLGDNLSWKPRQPNQKKKTDDTSELLPISLLGARKP